MTDPPLIEFGVSGLPAPQGSKNPWGGESSKNLRPWRNDIAVAAQKQMQGQPPHPEPVMLRAVFVFPRPKHHYGTGRNAGVRKASAPGWKSSAPDLDKLVRALGDALTGIVFRDDAQIVELQAVKIWGEHPGVTVTVVPV